MCMWQVDSRWYTPDLNSHHSNLSICSTVATRLVSWNRRNRCQKSNQKARACFTSGCCKPLPARYFLKGTNRKKSQSTMLPTELVTGYSTMTAQLRTTLCTVPIWGAVISISLHPLRITSLASTLQQISI